VYTRVDMSTQKRSIDWLTLKHFWQISMLSKKDFILSWFTTVSALGMNIVIPYLIGKILGGLVQPDSDPTGYIYILAVVSLLTVVINRISFSGLFKVQPKAMARLQTETLTALLKRGASYHNNRVSGKLVSDASDYPMAYNQLSNVFFIDVIPFLLSVVIGITIVFINSALIGLVILAMTVLAIWSGLRFRNRMGPARKIRHAASKAVTAHLSDAIVNNQTVKSFGNEDHELSQHNSLMKTLTAARMHDWHELAKDGSLRIFGLLLFQFTFILVVVNQIQRDPALLATGIFAFSYTILLSNRLFQIGTTMRQIEESLLLAMPMTEMLQEEPEIQDDPGAASFKPGSGDIRFSGITFHYNDNPRHDKVFKGLDLHIQPGEKVGLVGPSGGGKTTLTKLLLRFEDLQRGTISIDGQDISKITQTSLRRSIAYVPQEPLLFHRSIKENIAYGDPEATAAQVRRAAKLAYADEFIQKLPDGYDTIVGERGVKLSGGQRQRVAIARAILKDAPILVLDEATSALDSESEVAIQAALWELMQGRTTIVVAHRLSTIQRMDRIIVLTGGGIKEQGSHKDLLAQDGLYAKLWNHQSGGFIED
jgi:ATP-binding cassette, subfamily B, bacterial